MDHILSTSINFALFLPLLFTIITILLREIFKKLYKKFTKNFRTISKMITFISYFSNFNENVKRELLNYQTNLESILRKTFILFLLSLSLYVVIKYYHDDFTNFIVKIILVFFYPSIDPSIETQNLSEREKEIIVFVMVLLFLSLLLFILLLYLVLEVLYSIYINSRNNILKMVSKVLYFIFVFCTSISFLITAEYSTVINELFYFLFIALLLLLLFALFLYRSYNLVEELVYKLSKNLSKNKTIFPKVYIVAKNLRVVGEIVNLDSDRIEIIEKHSKKCKRYSIPWSEISDIFCVEVQKCS